MPDQSGKHGTERAQGPEYVGGGNVVMESGTNPPGAPTIRACGSGPLDPRFDAPANGRCDAAGVVHGSRARAQRRESTAGGSPAVFLDRDGTLIVDKPYSADPESVEVLDGVVEGLAMLREAGYRLIVVTNQSGIARGYYDEEALARMHRRVDQLLGANGVSVDAYYFCPHHVEGVDPSLAKPCPCRKPAPGMILRAAREWSIDLRTSWLVGDSGTDREAAERAGCRSILLGGRDPSGRAGSARDLISAARRIIARDARARARAAGGRRAALLR